jgi:hypothetical protein
MSLAAPSADPELLWASELHSRREQAVPWLWHGYLARGEITLLTSQWKVGKTTLISLLLDRLAQGGTLAGLKTRPARAIVVSEESPSHWSRRIQRFRAWQHVGFFCRPFRAMPDAVQWAGLIERLTRLRQERAIDLVVIDPLSAFLPRGTENLADKVLAALRPLERLTQEGVALLLLHHPKKGEVLAGQAARGSGALCAHADVLMEMHWVRQEQDADRRRRLCAWSRHEETPRERVIELSADGRDYRAIEQGVDAEFEQNWEHIQVLLACAEQQLTRKQILAAWPTRRRPSDTAMWRWLERAVQRKLVERAGQGHRHDPHRYQLPHRDLPWFLDPLELLDL